MDEIRTQTEAGGKILFVDCDFLYILQRFTVQEDETIRRLHDELVVLFDARKGLQQQKSSQKRKIERQRQTPVAPAKVTGFYVSDFLLQKARLTVNMTTPQFKSQLKKKRSGKPLSELKANEVVEAGVIHDFCRQHATSSSKVTP